MRLACCGCDYSIDWLLLRKLQVHRRQNGSRPAAGSDFGSSCNLTRVSQNLPECRSVGAGFNPHFSPAFYCRDGSGHVYCVALRRAPRRTVEYVCGALGRAPCIHARLRRLATKPGEKCGLTGAQAFGHLETSDTEGSHPQQLKGISASRRNHRSPAVRTVGAPAKAGPH